MIYYEDDRQKAKARLDSREHAYVVALEKVAVTAYNVWKNTSYASKPPALTINCLDELYDALSVVDFMADYETREE